jgi:hydrogenase nickel incorporation protein HypA/HybF
VHEISVAAAIVEQIEERLGQDGVQVVAVHLRIGELSAVVPDALQFAWDVVAEGTVLAGAALIIERIPTTIRCARCGEQRAQRGAIAICPQCGRPVSELVGGRELEIESVEVRDADPVG